MKLKQIASGAALVLAGLSAPEIASATIDTSILTGAQVFLPAQHATADPGTYEEARRGRGRGRGGDRDRGDRDDRDDRDDRRRHDADDRKNGGASGSGRSKPRIPGGSGCDDPRDIIEHPECRV